jgi:hypothetical protein
MPSFEETMENSRIFLTYSLAMTMLGKSAQILAERGADQKAMSFITTGIELLSQQLRGYAEKKELEEEVDNELDRICKTFDIKRA